MEENIRSVLRKVSKEKKVLAIESTFSVELDQEVEEMVIRDLKRMKSECEEYFTEAAISGSENKKKKALASFLLQVNESYFEKKVLFIDTQQQQEKEQYVYLRSSYAVKLYYLARVVFGPALLNRFVVWNTYHYRLDFKVKISSV